MAANTKTTSIAAQPSKPSGEPARIFLPLSCIAGGILAIVLLCYLASCCYNKLYRRNPSFRLVNLDMQVEDPSLRASVEKDLENCGVTGTSTHKQPIFAQDTHSSAQGSDHSDGIKLLREPGMEESFVHLPELDMKKLRETLLLNPRIEEARLQRIYPDTLSVKIEQRLPVAILHFPPHTGKGELLIDANGIILPRDLAAATNRLPSITGIKNAEAFAEGAKCESKGIMSFLTFLKESNIRKEGSQYQILNVRLEESEDRMFLTMAQNKLFKAGAQVVMPLDNVPDEMDRLKIIVEMRISSGETISKIDATFQNIPVKP